MADMARTSLARQQLSDAGVEPVYTVAIPDGHKVENNGKVILHVKNDGPADVQVTIQTGYARGDLRLANRVVTVPAGKSVFVGPLDAEVYNQRGADAGQVFIDYSAVDGVSIAALLLP